MNKLIQLIEIYAQPFDRYGNLPHKNYANAHNLAYSLADNNQQARLIIRKIEQESLIIVKNKQNKYAAFER